jgi:mRNA interferase RelE/StbE
LAYRVLWHEHALNDLKEFDRQTAGKVVSRVKDYLSQDPEKLGKPLKGVLKGLYRYRIGDYRIMYVIDKGDNQISILFAGKRKDIYR